MPLLVFLACCSVCARPDVVQEGPNHSSATFLSQQAGYPGSQWGQHPHLTGSRAADTAALYDTTSQHMLLHGSILPASVLGANLTNFSIPRAAGAGFSGLGNAAARGSAAASSSAQLLGGSRKPRLNNSISLNKQIMNTHSMRELHNIVRSKGAGFDFFNISSAIARVPKLVGQTGSVQVGLGYSQRRCLHGSV